jgi:hypothetical protein
VSKVQQAFKVQLVFKVVKAFRDQQDSRVVKV